MCHATQFEGLPGTLGGSKKQSQQAAGLGKKSPVCVAGQAEPLLITQGFHGGQLKLWGLTSRITPLLLQL